jgi:hypothetical protein
MLNSSPPLERVQRACKRNYGAFHEGYRMQFLQLQKAAFIRINHFHADSTT